MVKVPSLVDPKYMGFHKGTCLFALQESATYTIFLPPFDPRFLQFQRKKTRVSFFVMVALLGPNYRGYGGPKQPFSHIGAHMRSYLAHMTIKTLYMSIMVPCAP